MKMSEKEAIEIIKNTPLLRYEGQCGLHSELGDAMRMAVEALEKQIPKKPKIEDDFMECSIVCPNCGMHFGFVKWREEISDLHNNCRKCGQRIDWGE